MTGLRAILLLAAACFTAGAVRAATPLRADEVGAPRSNARAELFLPAGTGPFPAMVVLHGCDGVGPHYREWARRLVSWGYAALLVDSVRPRGLTNVCTRGMDVPFGAQADDAFAAAAYLRARPDISPGRIGVIGFSHGASATLDAALAKLVEREEMPPFRAAVAYYPGCGVPRSPLATDTLVLIGEADDWTPAQTCRDWIATLDRTGRAAELTVYPGAVHGFDTVVPVHVYAGHHVGGDAAARADALARTRAFLAARLQPGTGP